MRKLPTFTRVLSAAILLAGISAAKAEVSIETVALTGGPAPGTIGRTFLNFSPFPAVNASGEVVFSATLDPSDPSNDTGVWAETAGHVALVAREGDIAPDTIGRTFRGILGVPLLDSSGAVAFVARLDPSDSSNDTGVWAGTAGNLALVAREGDAAPGTGGSFGTLFRDLRLNGTGEVAFRNVIGTNFADHGVWSGSPSDLALTARTGNVAPGTSGETFTGLSFDSVVVNPLGEVGIRSGFSGGGRGIWIGESGGLVLAARGGALAPDAGGRTFRGFANHRVNGLGQVAFFADLNPFAPGTDSGIWVGSPGNLTVVALEGEPAPDIPGRTFRFLVNDPVLNELGQVAFRAFLDTSDFTNDTGIWVGDRESVTLVAREGDEAPGTIGRTFRNFGRRSLNGRGQIAFTAGLDASDPSSNFGLWAGMPGRLQLFLRTGDSLEVAPGDIRTVMMISLLNHSGNEDGLPSGFSDDGHIAVHASFTDGSQAVLVARLLLTIDDLIDTVIALDLNPGVENPLLDKLYAALNKLEDDNLNNDNAATSILDDFIAIVEAKRGKQISDEQADELVGLAEEIIASLQSA